IKGTLMTSEISDSTNTQTTEAQSSLRPPETQGAPVQEGGKISDKRLFIAVVAIGIATGLATFIMKEAIKWIGKLASLGMHIDRGNWLFLVLPVVGIMLAMIFQRYVVKSDLSHGTAMIKRDLQDGEYRLAPNLMYTNILGCSVTIGFGGSAGAEGPSAYTGAAIASNFSRWLHIDRRWLRLLIGVGAGAGIAGIFKSPVGGVLFTLEVLCLELNTLSVIALVAACLLSSCTALALGGFAFDMKFVDYMPFNPSNFFWMILLGLVCGLYSIYYNTSKARTDRILAGITNPWLRALTAGLSLSVAIYFFPSLFGEGYGIVDKVINCRPSEMLEYSPFYTGLSSNSLLMAVVAGVLILKGIMVGATINGGGVAGDFAPTLFAGCLVGLLFGMAMNNWFGFTLPVENYALLGMAGVMSGTIKAPLMAIFITAEMSNSYQFLFGFLIVAAVSYGVMFLWERYGMKKPAKNS
ncbi:MAG: chloride channel protein, partial [Muribaculaceae bacterium]|nr:chloride channel protein [Muribaculaceae bacterium]